MKKELQLFTQRWLILICFLSIFSAQAQVLNGSTYNIEAHFMKGRYSMNTGTTNARVSFIGKIVDGTNVIHNQLLDYNFEATNPTAMCYSYIGVEGPSGFLYGPDDEKNMGTLLNSPTYNFDFEVRSWRDYSSVSNTNSAACIYNSGDSGPTSYYGKQNANNGYQSTWLAPYEINFSGVDRSFYIKSTYRLAKGDRAAPLDFGALAANNTVFHTNYNLSAPVGANQKLGYANEWTPADNAAFTNDNDVTYTFSIDDSRTVSIATDFSTTTFDTKVHLVRLNDNGSFNSYITGNDRNGTLYGTGDNFYKGSINNLTICPGKYAVIVEGGNDDYTGYPSIGKLFVVVDVSNVYMVGGAITGGGGVPNPQEIPKTMTSTTDAVAGSVTHVTWEKATASTGYQFISRTSGSGANAFQSYTYSAIVGDPRNLTETTYFRRKVSDGCWNNTLNDYQKVAYSNVITYTVVNPNGVIKGKVVGRSNKGVNGIDISIQRNTSLSGGEANKVYTTTTGVDGKYNIEGIYYGEQVSGATANYTVTPSKAGHIFDYQSLSGNVTFNQPQLADVNFVDESTFSITGKITQECFDCEGATIGNPIICPIDTVTLLVNNVNQLDRTNPDGTYSISVTDVGNYTIKPKYSNHQFELNQRVVAITNEIETPNINFKDTTTHYISGYFTAGCNEYIGQASLRFTQILPNGTVDCFTKLITTNTGSGYYVVKLPAAKYQVSVVSITDNPTSINPLTVIDFLNALPSDSLIRNATASNKILNIVYPRPPVLQVVGLDNVCTTPTPFAIMEQNKIKTFTVKVWQGSAKTCPAKDSLIRLATNIQKDDVSENFEYANPTGSVEVSLKGGIPNIVAPYFKTFDLQYTDIYKRAATALNLNVAVTGLKSNIGTFTTVSPEIPLKILHDPQGDNSYSFWETNKTSETAMRFFRNESESVGGWEEVKIGTKFESGIGVTTEFAFWGSVKGSFNIGKSTGTANEAIMSISTTQNFSTASNDEVVGAKGDVYIGAALNLKYSKTHILSYTAPCTLTLKDDFIIAPDGFATNYIYTEGHIVSVIIPTLKDFSNQINNTPAEKENYLNQIKVWEQIVSNNAKNKRRATFEKNISFDGAAGAITSTTTTSSTKSSTIEFGLEVNTELAAELGMEAGGSGASGGVVINMKLETGKSETNTNTLSTTTGYSLDDAENGDYFSIDIKKDPVYDTPVFELIAGTSSCPWEEGTQPRDAMQLVASPSTVSGIAADGEAEFTLQLSNISQSSETRTYSLAFDQSSNPNGAEIKIGGSIVVGATQYTISSGGQINVLVKVKRGASNVYSYPGLTFTLSDNCDGAISKSVTLNAYFNSPCSPIKLFSPENNWVNISNTLPVIIKDYVKANLTSVALEYSKTGTSDWQVGFTKTSAELSSDAAGTLVSWNITSIPDGKYKLRLKLLCAPNNVSYSNTVSGVIDRVAPKLFGIPEPTDNRYEIGDVISAVYSENLGCANLNNSNLIVKNLKTNTIIPAQLGCFENKIAIVPLSNMGVLNDSIRVTLQNIQDVYGNIKTSTDKWKFILGNAPAATGNKALSLNPASVGLVLSMQENATGTMDFYFNLPANATNDVLINYSVSGSSNAANDYTVSYFPTNQPTSTKFNGTSGTITIKAGQKTSILKINPTGDTMAEADETIIITINEGGDYGIASAYIMTATILNDDGEDCLNGGNIYQLSNNNIGNTAIVAGIYHKSLLETNGKIVAPTNIAMKGAKSILMKPGFEVKVGSIFKATIEGCPPVAGAYSISTAEVANSNSNNFQFASINSEVPLSQSPVISDVKFEPNVLAAVDDKKIYFEFKLEQSENVSIVLLNNYGGEIVKVLDNTAYKAGTFTAEIETAILKKGDYFIKMFTKDKKTYQKVTVL